ncbi:MAG TPA: SRPBCC domain-containing protein [Flavobacteriales bacterium]|nr:SRPBCC domain-containing protein [Flavobacteriales bacterium]
MQANDFTTEIEVSKTPQEVFNAINNVRGWWSEQVEGSTTQLNNVFTYQYKDVHLCKIQLTEVIPYKKVGWHVVNNHFNFIQNNNEWVNTHIVFEITEKDGKTHVRFTHQGLVPAYECYRVCVDAWTSYIQGSLKSLVETGKGKPNSREQGLNTELIEKWNLPKK